MGAAATQVLQALSGVSLFAGLESSACRRLAEGAELREFSGVGHAPTLIADGQVQAVTDFLLQQGPVHETPGGRAA